MLSRERLAQPRVKCSTSELLYITVPSPVKAKEHDVRSIQNVISFVQQGYSNEISGCENFNE